MFLLKISVIIICHCMAAIKCHMNIINSETFQYLRTKNDFDFKNLVIFHDDPNGEICVQDFFEESLWNNMHMSVAFLYYRKDFKSQLAKVLQQSSGSLIILDDFDFLRETYNLSTSISDLHLRSNMWLFTYSTSHFLHILQNDVTEGIERWSTNVRYDSQLYILGGDENELRLLEAYRSCDEHPISISKLMRFSYGKINYVQDNFIWERRKNLEHCYLRLTYIDWPLLRDISGSTVRNEKRSISNWNPNNVLNANGKTFYGPEMQLFKLLVRKLNFSITWVQSKDNKFGTRDKHTRVWNGMVGVLATGKADMALPTLSVTNIRSRAIKYTANVYDCEYKLFMKMPGPTPSWSTLPSVFDFRYWRVFGICFVACSVSIFLLLIFSSSRLKSFIPKWHKSVTLHCISGIAATYSALMQKDIGLLYQYPDTFRITKRILMLTICFFGFMNYNIYNAGLTSNLMSPRYSFPITDIKDFLENREYKLIIKSGTAAESLLSESHHESYQKVWLKVVEENNVITDVNKAEDAIKNSRFNAFLWNSPLFEMTFDSYPCEIVSSTQSYASGSMAYAFNKKSPYVSLFTYHIRQLKESGVVRNVIWKNKQQQADIDCSVGNSYRPFNYGDILLVFVMSGVGFIIAILYCIVEYVGCNLIRT